MTAGAELLSLVAKELGNPPTLANFLTVHEFAPGAKVQVLYRTAPERLVIALVFDSDDAEQNGRLRIWYAGHLSDLVTSNTVRQITTQGGIHEWLGITIPVAGDSGTLARTAAAIALWLRDVASRVRVTQFVG
jgi:hypothetical protein